MLHQLLAALSVKVWLYGYVVFFILGLFWLWYPVKSVKDIKRLPDAALFSAVFAFFLATLGWVLYKVGYCVVTVHG